MMQVVPGSERWYCRVVDCAAFTWSNVSYGYCEPHLRCYLDGTVFEAKAGFPPVGSERWLKQTGTFHAVLAGRHSCGVCCAFRTDDIEELIAHVKICGDLMDKPQADPARVQSDETAQGIGSAEKESGALPSPPDGWQDISSAPKDGRILIWNARDEVCVVAMQHAGWSGLYSQPGRYPVKDATHWMPLPPPPQPTRDEK